MYVSGHGKESEVVFLNIDQLQQAYERTGEVSEEEAKKCKQVFGEAYAEYVSKREDELYCLLFRGGIVRYRSNKWHEDVERVGEVVSSEQEVEDYYGLEVGERYMIALSYNEEDKKNKTMTYWLMRRSSGKVLDKKVNKSSRMR